MHNLDLHGTLSRMTIFDSIILGIVEGVTEFLPISSTGHLILASSLLGLEHTEFLKSFEIAIQFGAILSVVTLYFRSFFDIEIIKRLIVAFAPTALIGLLLYPFIKGTLIGNETLVVGALAVGGIALIAFELLHTEQEDGASDMKAISYLQAFAVGLFQAIAVIPGVSRSAATIIGGLLFGIRRVAIVEFSFLLAVPTMLSATALDLFESSAIFTGSEWTLLAIGFIVSYAVALLSIRWLLSYVRHHTFIPFGVYRILIALLFFALILY